MLDDMELDIPEASPPPDKPSGNRGFITAVSILGGIMLLALIAMLVYALVILPGQQRAAEEEGLTAVELTSTAVARGLAQVTNTVAAASPTASPTRTATVPPPTNTPRPSNTPVTPLFTDTPGTPANDATATVNALLTQAALAQTQAIATSDGTATATTTPATATSTPSALPQSGFAEDLGAPSLLLAAGILVVIIIVSRRLRSA
jgi:hypothetical protein